MLHGRGGRARILAIALVATAGCANSSLPDTGRDAEGAPDGSAPPRDGATTTRDGSSPPADGSTPTGPCADGREDLCTTECGSVGRVMCVGGTWGPCTVPAEDCNGRDDDCDGMIDDAVGERMCSSECGGGSERCVSGSWTGCSAVMPREETCDGTDQDCDSQIDEGLTRGCSTACGSGTERCSSGSWIGCSAPSPLPESCNGVDDDCDGTVDDGLRAAVEPTTYTALSGHHAGCNASTRIGPDCNAAMHRYCAARGCTTSGFGPVENSGDVAYVTCVVGSVQTTSYSVLRGHHPECEGAAQRMGPACNAAMHRWCAATGYASGFGPVENSGDTAIVTCVPGDRASVVTTSYSALSGHHAPCDGFGERMGPNCNAAIHRFCAASGYASGFGPVENSGDVAVITCVRP